MTDTEINIAIAEACGWEPGVESERPYRSIWKRENVKARACDLPDYCHDLNAMHEAESFLSHIQRNQFAGLLLIATRSDAWEKQRDYMLCELRNDDWLIAHATARQRAEAFLHVKGLLKGEA